MLFTAKKKKPTPNTPQKRRHLSAEALNAMSAGQDS